MNNQVIQKHFKRVETKYILEKNRLNQLIKDLVKHMEADNFAQSTITSVYFDNPKFQMIEDALAKKHGKEKIRMRLYDQEPTADSQAFLEIKKKVNGVGFKYRLTAKPVAVVDCVTKGQVLNTMVEEDVTAHLKQLRHRYGKLQPQMVIAYDRQSFKGKVDKTVRLTIDQNLIYRDHELAAYANRRGHALLPSDQVIIEVKVAGEKPEWLVDLLEAYGLEKISFSKYGQAYLLNQARLTKQKEVAHA